MKNYCLALTLIMLVGFSCTKAEVEEVNIHSINAENTVATSGGGAGGGGGGGGNHGDGYCPRCNGPLWLCEQWPEDCPALINWGGGSEYDGSKGDDTTPRVEMTIGGYNWAVGVPIPFYAVAKGGVNIDWPSCTYDWMIDPATASIVVTNGGQNCTATFKKTGTHVMVCRVYKGSEYITQGQVEITIR